MLLRRLDETMGFFLSCWLLFAIEVHAIEMYGTQVNSHIALIFR